MIKDYIFIGKILKFSGKKGKFKVYPLTDFPDRFKDLDYVYIYDEKIENFLKDGLGNERFIINDVKISGDHIYITLNDVEDRKDLYKGCYLCVEEAKRVKLAEGMYYYYELIGCKIYLEGNLLGSVSSIENYGSDDLLVLLKNDKKKVFIPLREEFIQKIDLENKTIDIKYLEGLID